MRLKKIESGPRLSKKLTLALIGLKLGERAPDVLRTVWYRPDFFGKHYSRYLNAVMRGPSEWSVGERELFAAFVSRLNECAF
ncbi:MAG: hypothetical protein PVG59_14885 [Desulfobacterales bacterium]|jgi:alkylhydroperoxidase family enzyme